MNINIGTVDGRTYQSIDIDVDKMNEDLAAVGGDVFTGRYADRRVNNFEELWESIEELLTYNTKNTYQTFTMETHEYGAMTFNVKHIVWWSRVD